MCDARLGARGQKKSNGDDSCSSDGEKEEELMGVKSDTENARAVFGGGL